MAIDKSEIRAGMFIQGGAIPQHYAVKRHPTYGDPKPITLREIADRIEVATKKVEALRLLVKRR
jgi:hypothetical protein